MKPLTKPTWKYISPGALATSGIYSQEDLEGLKDHIMFPAERPAVILNTIRRIDFQSYRRSLSRKNRNFGLAQILG